MPKVLRAFQIQPSSTTYHRWEDIPPDLTHAVDTITLFVGYAYDQFTDDSESYWEDVYVHLEEGLEWLDDDQESCCHHAASDSKDRRLRKQWRDHVMRERNWRKPRRGKREWARERLRAQRNVWLSPYGWSWTLSQSFYDLLAQSSMALGREMFTIEVLEEAVRVLEENGCGPRPYALFLGAQVVGPLNTSVRCDDNEAFSALCG